MVEEKHLQQSVEGVVPPWVQAGVTSAACTSARPSPPQPSLALEVVLTICGLWCCLPSSSSTPLAHKEIGQETCQCVHGSHMQVTCHVGTGLPSAVGLLALDLHLNI